MNGIVGLDNQHKIGNVCLCISTAVGSFNSVAGYHTCVDGSVGIVNTLHVACEKPRHYHGYEW